MDRLTDFNGISTHGGACSVMVIFVGSGLDYLSLNTRVVANVLDWDIVVNEFELPLCYNI